MTTEPVHCSSATRWARYSFGATLDEYPDGDCRDVELGGPTHENHAPPVLSASDNPMEARARAADPA